MIQRTNNRSFWLILMFFSLTSGAVSLAIGLRQSVWFDEAYSILLAQHSWGDIVRLTAQDVHPPVYYWLLKAWMLLFGSGELALRSLSALMLGGSVGVAGLLLRRMFGSRLALIALPFIVFAPFLLRYGFEVRMYSFASLIGIGATYVLVLAQEAKVGKKHWLLYGLYSLLVTVGIYTLYFMALVWITHFVWVIWLAYKAKQPKRALPAVVAYVVAFVSFLPWLPIFLGKAGGSTLSSVTHALWGDHLIGVLSYTLLYRAPWQLGGIGIAALIAALLSIVYLAYRGYKAATPQQRPYLLLLGFYVAVPLVVLVVVTHFRPVYIERYLAHFIIGGYAFIGVSAALLLTRGRWINRIPVAVMACIMLAGCPQLVMVGNYNFQRVHTPTIKQVAGLLTDCRGGAVIVANEPQTATELMYYVKDCPVRFYNETSTMGGGFAMLSGSPLRVANPKEEFRGAEKLYYVYYNKPKLPMPDTLHRTDVATVGAVRVATYVHD